MGAARRIRLIWNEEQKKPLPRGNGGLPFASLQVISLWDMIQWYAKDAVYLGLGIERLIKGANPQTKWASRESFEAWLKDVAKHATVLELECVLDKAQSLLATVKKSASWPPAHCHVFSGEVNEILSRFESETKFAPILVIAKERRRYVDEKWVCKDFDASKFPNLKTEFSEAGRCFAYGRFTAAVHHLCRGLEEPLEMMAKELKVTVDPHNKNWGKIIGDMQKAVSDFDKGHGKIPKKWRGVKKSYNDAAAQFIFIKDGYRNPAAHLAPFFVEEKAAEIFNGAQAFAGVLSTGLPALTW
jgi:hypothetical protein